MRDALKWASGLVWILSFSSVLTTELRGATIAWDGGGGDGLWQTAANWTGDVLPGAADDVILTAAGGPLTSITNTLQTTVRSLQSSNALVQLGGSLRLTTGPSRLDGPLTLMGNPLFTVSGTGSVLSVYGSFEMTAGTLQAIGGGRISLESLASYAKPPGCFAVIWKADGAGSRFDLPTLESLSGGECASIHIQADRGGIVDLPALTNLTEGQVMFLSEGAGSVVDLPLLNTATARLRSFSFEARNLGRVNYPGFSGSPMAIISRRSGGVIPVDRLTELRGFTIGGASADFPLLTRLGNSGITIESGAVVSLSNLTVHTSGNSCEAPLWSVSGTGSQLRLPSLSTLAGPECGSLGFRAFAGGLFQMPNLSRIEQGSITILADGAGSRVELPQLESCLGDSLTVGFEARNLGEVQVPRLPGGEVVTVAVGTGGILPVAQMTRLKGFSVNAMPVEFPELVQLGNANITVSGGGIASTPKLLSHLHPLGCVGTTWLATGAGSRLDFSALRALTGASCGNLAVRAAAGATVDLNTLGSLSEGVLSFVAEGTNSLINLAKLEDASTAQRSISFDARNSGVLAMPTFRGGPAVSVTIRSGGTLDATQMTLLKSMLVSGTRLAMPGVTRLFSGSLIVEEGGELSFPNLIGHSHGSSCAVSLWSATGAGSLLDLMNLTSLQGPDCGALAIEAVAGGRVAMGGLQRVVEGRLELLADGTNSVIDLASWQRSDATSREVLLEARNQGSLLMPQLGGGETVGLTVRSNGVIAAGQLSWLASVTASRVNLELTGLTNLNSGSLAATDGSIISLPGLRTYLKSSRCDADAWSARGAGSALELPNLVQLAAGDCVPLTLEASSGGRISLPLLTNVPSGWVQVIATGAGSSMQLPTLGNFVDAERRSSLVATNGGTIDLGSGALITSGVLIRISPGSPGLPPTLLDAHQLVLHGQPWHSYRVDRYLLPATGGEAELYVRVPLLTEFQSIGAAVEAGLGFIAKEFVMDPPGLELSPLSGIGVRKVVYGPPGKNYDLLATERVDAVWPWPWLATITLTNSFSILPDEPLSIPQRYFKLQGPMVP
ncbi:MAG: hypothetical protein JNN07_28920 [Verrucomicrobiales bacterium]|nr:hypothetical protein [Verrucomicrobiales bacterium]